MKCLDIFAGAGGLALGLEMSGFDSVGLVEFDKQAVATLKLNRENWNVQLTDITKIEDVRGLFGLQLGELDLLSGGPPCQSFSNAGKRGGFNEERGKLFLSYAYFLKQLKPKMFLFENVVGLTNHNQGKTFEVIRETLEDCGYDLAYQILNANDYGVAQNRKRLIIVGARRGLRNVHFAFPRPQDTKPNLADALAGVPESEYMAYTPSQELIKKIPAGGNWKSLPSDIAAAYIGPNYHSPNRGGMTGVLRRLSWDAPAPTLMTCPRSKIASICHPDFDRPLTIRESARVQSFPDDWQFAGGVASQYKQIGNAVPPLLGKALGLSIKEALSKVE